MAARPRAMPAFAGTARRIAPVLPPRRIRIDADFPPPIPKRRRLAGMLDLVPVATVILDRPGLGILAGNAEAAGLLGCRPDRLAEVWRSALEGGPARCSAVASAAVTSRERPEVFDVRLERPTAPRNACWSAPAASSWRAGG